VDLLLQKWLGKFIGSIFLTVIALNMKFIDIQTMESQFPSGGGEEEFKYILARKERVQPA
jgi:hypothetical protein